MVAVLPAGHSWKLVAVWPVNGPTQSSLQVCCHDHPGPMDKPHHQLMTDPVDNTTLEEIGLPTRRQPRRFAWHTH